jgi:hypothetical protein
MSRSRRLLGLLLIAGLALTPAISALTQQAVTISFPRGGRAAVGLTSGPMLVRSVTLKGRPSTRDLRKSRRDPDDTTLLHWRFQVANAGRRDWHARIRVKVLASDDRLLAANDREGEVDGKDWHDHITVWTRIRTLDYARADRVLVEADFFPD